MDDELELPEIPQGFFEYKGTFAAPVFDAWFNRHGLLKEMYEVLKPWGIDLERVSGTENAKNLKEAQIIFALANPPVLVNVGMGGITMAIGNADWSDAPVLVDLFQTVLDNAARLFEGNVATHHTVLGLHLKPGIRPFRQILNQFVNAKALGNEDASSFGIALYGDEYSLLLDNSGAVANGLFIKITRAFAAETKFQDMASKLWNDEESLLRRLGFRMEQ